MKDRIRSRHPLVKFFLLYPLALILLFEEWGWEPLARFISKLFRIIHLESIEEKMKEVKPFIALLFVLVPLLFLFPLKIVGLYLIKRGQGAYGVLLFIGAKVFGTAVCARLFQLAHPRLMTNRLYARIYPRWKRWKDQLLNFVRSTLPHKRKSL